MEKIAMRDKMEIIVKDRNGEVKNKEIGYDLITDAGKAIVAGLINGVITNPFKYIAIGTGTTAESSGDTALENEVARKEATVSRITTSVDNDTAKFVATFSSSDGLSGSSTITESGVFDAASGGNMLCRKTFDGISVNWDNGDTLEVTWEIQIQ